MQQQDWSERWEGGQIGFHQETTTAALADHADAVWGDTVGRVFVPLCGKSLDMVFLAERADHVVGVEFVEQAVEEFFTERSLAPVVDREPLVRHAAGSYTLFAADFFELTVDHVGVIDSVFDRASMVALDPSTRSRYVAHMETLLPPGVRTLLITFDYDQTQMQGPPFAVSDDEVLDRYRSGFEIDHVATRDVLNDVFRQRGLSSMTESTFVLTRRGH